jgi:transcriptional regulator with XRE-family HTH domain
MDDLITRIGKLVKERRLSKGYSTQELADKLSVSTGLINNIENSKTDTFNVTLMSKLCSELDISIPALLLENPQSIKDSLAIHNNIPESLSIHINRIIEEYALAAIKLNFNTDKLEKLSKKLLHEIKFVTSIYE